MTTTTRAASGLSAEGLSKRYPAPRGGVLDALADVSFAVAPGQIFGLVGPNGAGKTTTIRILAGLLTPDAGRALVESRVIREDDPASRSLVGWMPDFFGIYAELGAWEYLDFFAEASGVPDRARRIDETLERVGLSHKRDARVGELSRGMVQRLCIARTLLPDPPVLLLDEPASGLDPHARSDLKRLVRDLAAEGRAILVSSHILIELQEMVTHLGILERGRMVYCGPASGVGVETEGEESVRHFEIRLANAASSTEALARWSEAIRKAIPQTREIRETPSGLALRVPASHPAEGLLASLVGAGVPVVHFAEARDLESIFLRATKGETQ